MRKNGRILILSAELNDVLLIIFFNSNSECEQLSSFSTVQKLLKKIDDYNKKHRFGGDFNLIFDSKFDSSGGNPTLKRSI